MIKVVDGAYKQRVIIQKNPKYNNIAICSGWNKPERYSKYSVAIIGSLYSINGIPIILHNLLANKQLQIVLLLDNNRLGLTCIGQKGISAFVNIFTNNMLSTDPESNSLSGELSKEEVCELNETILFVHVCNDSTKYYINKTEIYSTSGKVINLTDEFLSNCDKLAKEKLKIRKIEKLLQFSKQPNKKSLPSEYFGFNFHGISLIDSWVEIMKLIIKYGKNHSKLMRELQVVQWSFPSSNLGFDELYNLIKEQEIRKMINVTKCDIDEYERSLLDPNNENNQSYTYGERLAPYIPKIIDVLKKNIHSRHAFATTLNLQKDTSQPPCLTYLQILYDNVTESLNMYCVFRSHDIFKASILNACALAYFLKYISNEVGQKPGYVNITSNSAHIYLDDFDNATKLIDCLNGRRKIPLRLDPRGNVVITKIEKNKYHFQLFNTTTNEQLYSMTGTRKYIFKMILCEGIIKCNCHLNYIFDELFDK
jgi:thymidylate synthase